MTTMPMTLHWTDAVIRLLLALAIGGAFGLNRSESGKAAGLRTTLLVCAAACLSMLQVNALLMQSGKDAGSFAVLDLMRLPLGILTGMGFIGAGAVLRRDGLVTGVTTAATLWFVTVLGLCVGGGQLALGVGGAVVGLVVLQGLRALENRLRTNRRALLEVVYRRELPCRERLVGALRGAGYTCTSMGMRTGATAGVPEGRYRERFAVKWREAAGSDAMATMLTTFALEAGADSVEWSIGEPLHP